MGKADIYAVMYLEHYIVHIRKAAQIFDYCIFHERNSSKNSSREILVANFVIKWSFETTKKYFRFSLRTGFEPVREDPNGFQVHRLNHSAIAAAVMT